MQDAERWSYTPTDVMGENRFFTGQGNSSWKVSVGDHIASKSVLRLSELNDLPPFAMKRISGKASVITSTGWVMPNRYQSEGPLLSAAYGLLDGMNGFCWEGFSAQPTVNAQVTLFINPKSTWLMVWNCASPPLVDSFPAAALMFRNGGIREGVSAVHEARPLADLWIRQPPAIADHASPAPAAAEGNQVDPLAYFVGPVTTTYGVAAHLDTNAALSACIDRAHRRVTSSTGELLLDYGAGYCQISAPRAQGVIGFLRTSSPIELGAVTISSADDYVALLVVPLDDASIADSHKLLVQSCTTATPSGWMTKPVTMTDPARKVLEDAEEVTSVGGPPWRIVCNHSWLSISNSHLTHAWAVDAAGFRTAEVPCQRHSGALTFTMPANCFHVVIQ
jgi:hypothetical protein